MNASYGQVRRGRRRALAAGAVILALVLLLAGAAEGVRRKRAFRQAPAEEPQPESAEELMSGDGTMLMFVCDRSKRISGFYTGRYSEQSGYIQLDYMDSALMIDSSCALPVMTEGIISAGAVSQQGRSACGAACLYMLMENSGAAEARRWVYGELLRFAEEGGFNDQGSLFSEKGGMSTEVLQELSEEAYSVSLENVYSEEQEPSEILAELIGSGRQAIVLIQSREGQMVTEGGYPHFVLVTGCQRTGEELRFIIADSNFYGGESPTLKFVSAEQLDGSAGSVTGETRAILCVD